LQALQFQALPPQINLVLLLNHPSATRQSQLGQVVLIQALHEVALRALQRGLRLHQRQRIVDARIEAVGLIGKRLRRQIDIGPRYFHQLLRRLYIQQGGTYLLIDPAAQISQLQIHALQLRLGNLSIAAQPGFLKDRDLQGSHS